MTTATVHPDPGTTRTNQLNPEELVARGWAALPPSYRMPETAPTLAEARAWCNGWQSRTTRIFTWPSWFLPKALRPHFHAIYAYCRVSDDLGDEVGDTAQALALLDMWGRELDACYEGRCASSRLRCAGRNNSRLFDSQGAVRRPAHRISPGPDRHALSHDAAKCWSIAAIRPIPLVAWCSMPADIADEERFRLSDATCSALQLANFWQDVRVDFAKDRVYLPQEDMRRFGVSDETIAQGNRHARTFARCMQYEVDFARRFLKKGCRSSAWSVASWRSTLTSSAVADLRFCAPSNGRTTMC